MSNLTQKIGYRVMAFVMAVLMFVGMLPISTIAYAVEETENEAYKAKNFTAAYNAATDSVDLAWDAFEVDVYALYVAYNGAASSTKITDVKATTFSVPVSGGGYGAYGIVAYADENDTEGTYSDSVNVLAAYTLASVPAFSAVEVDNGLTVSEIIAQLPAETDVLVSEETDLKVEGQLVQWNAESANYDQTKTEEQTVTIPGVIVLDTKEVQNRNNLSLECSVEVKVKAAVDVSITTDLDDTAPVEKKVGESLALSVAAAGTAPAYQWFKKTAGTEGTAIDGATSATFTISSLTLADAAQYYCTVTGKNQSAATSKVATVNVSKNPTAVDLSITPPEGQTRPDSITLEAVGIPNDATGKVIIKEGESNILAEIDLPSDNISATFKASGTNNNYDFTVIYDAGDDNLKYLGSEKVINGYGFNKGQQTVNFVDGTIPTTTYIYAKDTTFTVQAENGKTGKYEYAIVDEVDADGAPVSGFVAEVDATGKVTILAAGTFKIAVKALSDDDYNESSVEKSAEIKVERAEQGQLGFESGVDTITYSHGFTYSRALEYVGTGDGVITYSLGKATTATGVAVNSETGEITFTDAANDNSTQFNGSVGVVEVVATKAADKQWKPNVASYKITIEKAEQSVFKFADEEPAALTYTENNGTTFTNVIVIPSDSAKSGRVTVKNAPVYSVFEESTLADEPTSGVVSVDDANPGKITAHKSGKVTIMATLAGNGVYNQTTATYSITVNRGTVKTVANGTADNTGFHFEKADSNIKYGYVGFVNVAVGGQTDSNSEISYSVNSEEVTVSANGVITFDKAPADAENTEYKVTVTAKKEETDKYEEQTISYELTVTRDAVDPATDFKVNGETIKNAADLTSADNWYNAEHGNITITPDGKYSLISENGKDWTTSIVRDADAEHDIAFYLKDDEGNTSQLSQQKVNYDKTFATAKLSIVDDDGKFWLEFLETISFGIWKNESQSILVEAEDNLSGIKSIEYYEQNSEFVVEETAENVANASFAWKKCALTTDELKAEATVKVELEELTNKKAVVYVKITDYADNVSYFRTDGMVLDNITPEPETNLPKAIINIQLAETETQGLYNEDVPFTVTVNDPTTNNIASGIKEIKVTVSGKESDGTTHEKTIVVKSKHSEIYSFNSDEVNTAEFTVEGDFVVPVDFNSNHVTILVEVTDYAGNPNTCIKNLAVDKTVPAIKVSYDDVTITNKKYIGNDQNRVATIEITELNFDQSNVKINITRDFKSLVIQPDFAPIENAVDANGDQIGWKMTIDYATLGEGGYTFDISCTDKAEWPSEGWDGDDVDVNKNFVIDNTKPTITVNMTNSDVKNQKYFAANRIATVIITERNFSTEYQFDWSGMTLNGKALSAPGLNDSDDDTYERKYVISFTAEGDYTFDVKYTDLAGNVADPYVCKAVAHKEFTIDKTEPSIVITGVEDKSANNGEVAPIVTLTDTNYNRDAVSIVLNGVNNGDNLKYSGSYKDITNGQTYTYADFERVQSVDDIYILTVVLEDMAGNTSQQTITFSANRFGSVYDLTALKELNGKYLPEEEDIVFTETNVDTLDREAIVVKLTVNGTPKDLVEGEDFTVTATGGNGQWSVYTYTINKSLFANDGRYSISVYSEDAAGNVNENIDETKEAEISFGIDKTKPVVVPIDFESGVQYAVDSKTVTVEIKDNLVLEGVKIYLNGQEVNCTVDGDNYIFNIPKSNRKQTVKIVAVDAAGNEEPVEVIDFLVNANIFVRWFNNTPLFVGSIIGFVVVALAITGFIVFGKKKKEEETKVK